MAWLVTHWLSSPKIADSNPAVEPSNSVAGTYRLCAPSQERNVRRHVLCVRFNPQVGRLTIVASLMIVVGSRRKSRIILNYYS